MRKVRTMVVPVLGVVALCLGHTSSARDSQTTSGSWGRNVEASVLGELSKINLGCGSSCGPAVQSSTAPTPSAAQGCTTSASSCCASSTVSGTAAGIAQSCPTSPSACATTGAPNCTTPTLGCATGRETFSADPAAHVRIRATRSLGARDLSVAVENIRKTYQVPGLAVAVMKDGRLYGAGVAGARVAGGADALQIDDAFHLGSCGKTFTATIAAQLVAKGMISWNTTIGEVFPELRPHIRSQYLAVTLSQLLSHRSGIPVGPDRGPGDKVWPTLLRQLSVFDTPTLQREAALRHVLNLDPLSPPGAQFAYTDWGYTVAGALLERTSKRTYAQLLDEYIAGPIDAATFGEGAPGTAESMDQPRGHVNEGGRIASLRPERGADLADPLLAPAGTTHASILDWARFAAEHLNAYNGVESAVIPAEVATAFFSDEYHQGYAKGWQTTTLPESKATILHHSGTCGAWGAVVWVIPEENLVITTACNYGGSNGFAAIDALLRAAVQEVISING